MLSEYKISARRQLRDINYQLHCTVVVAVRSTQYQLWNVDIIISDYFLEMNTRKRRTYLRFYNTFCVMSFFSCICVRWHWIRVILITPNLQDIWSGWFTVHGSSMFVVAEDKLTRRIRIRYKTKRFNAYFYRFVYI